MKREEAFDVMKSRGFFQSGDSSNSIKNRVALQVWDAFTVEGAWDDYPKDGPMTRSTNAAADAIEITETTHASR